MISTALVFAQDAESGEEDTNKTPVTKEAIAERQSKIEAKLKVLEEEVGVSLHGKAYFNYQGTGVSSDLINTTNATRADGGDTRAYLNFKVNPVNEFGAGAVLKITAPLENMWGGREASVHRVWAETAFKNILGLRVGNFQKSYTPLTLSLFKPAPGIIAPVDEFYKIEAFEEDISLTNDDYPLFGANARFGLQTRKDILGIDVDAFTHVIKNNITFTANSDSTEENIYSKYMSGLQVEADLLKKVQAAFTYSFYGELSKTGPTPSDDGVVAGAPLKNRVSSFMLSSSPLEGVSRDFELDLAAELAYGKLLTNYFTPDVFVADTAFYVDVNFGYRKNYFNFVFSRVPLDFISLPAQTRGFDYMQQGPLNQGLFDSYTARYYRSEVIEQRPDLYNDFEVIHPFSRATPNRMGFNLAYSGEFLRKAINAGADFGYYKEITTFGAASVLPISFYEIGVDADLNFFRLFKRKFLPQVVFKFNTEQGTRDDDPLTKNDSEAIYNRSTLIQAGVNMFPTYFLTLSAGYTMRDVFIYDLRLDWVNYIKLAAGPYERYIRTESENALYAGVSLNIKNLEFKLLWKTDFVSYGNENTLNYARTKKYTVNSLNGLLMVKF